MLTGEIRAGIRNADDAGSEGILDIWLADATVARTAKGFPNEAQIGGIVGSGPIEDFLKRPVFADAVRHVRHRALLRLGNKAG